MVDDFFFGAGASLVEGKSSFFFAYLEVSSLGDSTSDVIASDADSSKGLR
jgi:hypothetical protein